MSFFFIICHDFNPSVWHTQRMRNFVTIFLWRFFAPVWHSLKEINSDNVLVSCCFLELSQSNVIDFHLYKGFVFTNAKIVNEFQ